MSFKERSTNIKNEIFEKKSKSNTLSDIEMIKKDKHTNDIKCNEICSIGKESKFDIFGNKLPNDCDIDKLNENKKFEFQSNNIYKNKRNKVNLSKDTKKKTKNGKNRQNKKSFKRNAEIDNPDNSDSNLLSFETELENLCPFKCESDIGDKNNILLTLKEDTSNSKKIQSETIKSSEMIDEICLKSNFNKNNIGKCLDRAKCSKKKCSNCKKYIKFIDNLLETNRNK
ncbi:hypothetical protein CWI37_0054p0050 [Hamiltosporidium tvaerminnensis]|uniref:Uncharacterized protein n=1 Tax=Hamiltosporidium tvaerminnensis TaxID=1176355 RepID=A0A4Q9LDF5_9MICR|nr:hypothetical protein CWI37_0054p0050 [Hamiltosporidium tvaerminnensis]